MHCSDDGHAGETEVLKVGAMATLDASMLCETAAAGAAAAAMAGVAPASGVVASASKPPGALLPLPCLPRRCGGVMLSVRS